MPAVKPGGTANLAVRGGNLPPRAGLAANSPSGVVRAPGGRRAGSPTGRVLIYRDSTHFQPHRSGLRLGFPPEPGQTRDDEGGALLIPGILVAESQRHFFLFNELDVNQQEHCE